MNVIIMLLFIFASPIIIAMFYLAYKSLYQKNINQSLDRGTETRMIEPLPFLGFISLAALLIISIVSLTKISNMQSQLDDLQRQINDLTWQNQQVNTKVNTITGLLNDFEQSEKDIQGFILDYSTFNTEDITFDVDILINIREIKTNETFKMLVINRDTDEMTEFNLNTPTLTYSDTLRLSVDSNYTFIIQKTDGTSVINLESKNLDLKSIYNNIYFVEKITHPDSGQIFIPLDEVINDAFIIESLKIEVFEDDVLVNTTNVSSNDLDQYYVYDFNYEFNSQKSYKFVVSIINKAGLSYQYDIIF